MNGARKPPGGAVLNGDARGPLRDHVSDAVDGYFDALGDEDCGGLYDLVMGEVEAPLFAAVLRRAGGNQTRAARILGINRGTLRKKLRQYALD